MHKEPIIIGLTGRFGAGCGTTSSFLQTEQKFVHLRFSAVLKQIAKQKDTNFERRKSEDRRAILQDLGDALRKKDPNTLAQPIIEEIKKKKFDKVVVETIRNPSEIEAFRQSFPNFSLIAIDAETETRWERLRHIYKGNQEPFIVNDERDAGIGQPDYGQHVKRCIDHADVLINNNKNFYISKGRKDNKAIDCYAQKLFDYICLLNKPGIRQPSNDELYMHYACSIALRSNCLKRQVGAVIIHEKYPSKHQKSINKDNIESYVIATGCNNVPIGERHCKEEYADKKEKCYRDNIKNEHYNKYVYCRQCGAALKDNLVCNKCKLDNKKLPGKLLDLCRAVHAEEAAILQAAKLGSTSLEDAKLYTSTFPCMLCCKEIINAGIKNVVYLESYPMGESLAIDMFRKCGIQITKFEGVNSIAFNRIFRRN